MKALLIIACSATKRPDAGLMPALERYNGPAFSVLRKARRERPELCPTLDIRILSAEFGLIEFAQYIPNYDRKMTTARALELRPTVQPAYEALQRQPWDAVRIDLGQVYWEAVYSPWEGPCDVGHGSIGERLAQLKAWLWGLPL